MTLISTLLALLPLAAGTLPETTTHPPARPDQVLVVYNADWTQDLDGSEPGQDSEELARYYVARHTDPTTGRRPWLLGLTAPGGEDSPLNRVYLPEKSADNGSGLVYRGADELVADPWPLSTTHGDAAVPIEAIESGRARSRYAAAWIAGGDAPQGQVRRLRVGYFPTNGQPVALVDLQPGAVKRHPAVTLVPRPSGTLVLLDMQALPYREGKFRIRVDRIDGAPLDLVRELSGDDRPTDTGSYVSLADHRSPLTELPERSGFLPRLLSAVDLLALSAEGKVYGVVLNRGEVRDLQADSVAAHVRSRLDPARGTILYRGSDGALSPAVSAFRLKNGGLLLAGDLSMHDRGSVVVTWTGRKQDGTPWERSRVLHDPRDFEVSETGPDGIRDDSNFLELIAAPVQRFLETHETDDGIRLRDHVLYIVVVHGLPLRVRSLYGIRRGVPGGRENDLGAGSSLTQRIQTLYYDLSALQPKPVIVNHRQRNAFDLPTIAHPLITCLTGQVANPFLHPLAHDPRRAERLFEQAGLDGLRTQDPPVFTTALRKSVGAPRFLFGATRLDGRTIEGARSRVDGAVYASRYLTPQIGPSYIGKYQEAPLTGRVLEKRGFEVRPATGHERRALFYFGVFGYGAAFQQSIGKDPEESVLWEDGFLPGGIGYAIRSFLGWDRRRPPSGQSQLFEQVLRADATVTAGSAGGAHDTNFTWPDSLVLTHLLFEGYDLGDALLRSTVYLDWTLSAVGDPLYRACLAETAPDATPPVVPGPESIHAEVSPSGPGTFALRVQVDLGNDDPEMVETLVRCWPEDSPDEVLRGRNSRFRSRPSAVVDGLRPEKTYRFAVELIDPYGNRFDSESAFGAGRTRTPEATEPRVVQDRKFLGWKGETNLIVYDAALDETGEIEITFAPTRRGGMPEITTQTGWRLFDTGGLAVGGARAEVAKEGPTLEKGVDYRLRIRWRRFPVTREALLVAPDGTEHVLATANGLPWDPRVRIGTSLDFRGDIEPRRIVLRNDAPAAPPARRTILPWRLDAERYREHGGTLTD